MIVFHGLRFAPMGLRFSRGYNPAPHPGRTDHPSQAAMRPIMVRG